MCLAILQDTVNLISARLQPTSYTCFTQGPCPLLFTFKNISKAPHGPHNQQPCQASVRHTILTSLLPRINMMRLVSRDCGQRHRSKQFSRRCTQGRCVASLVFTTTCLQLPRALQPPMPRSNLTNIKEELPCRRPESREFTVFWLSAMQGSPERIQASLLSLVLET